MKHTVFRKAAGLILVAALLAGSLAGCGRKEEGTVSGMGENADSAQSENNKEKAMGRYLEEELSWPENGLGGIFDVKKLEDGTIRLAGSDGNGINKVWDSRDAGESWQEVYELPGELQESDKGYMEYASLSPDGTLACVFEQISDQEITPVCYLVDSAGACSEIPFEIPETEDKETNMILDIQFLEKEELLIQDMQNQIYQVRVADGTVTQTYDESFVAMNQYYTAGKWLLVSTDTELLLYDTENGQQQAVEETLQKGMAEMGNITALDTMDKGESIYCLTGGGLYHYRFGGTLVEQLIDGTMNLLGSPSFYPLSLIMLDEQNLLVAAYDSASANPADISLLKYTYSPDTPAKPSKELKIYSLYDNREIRQMITHFQKENPEVYINFEVALSEENGVTVSDALKTLTTEIMAGKGPDVLILDGLSVETYMEKGLLTDLSGVLKEAEGSYFKNIVNAYKDEKGQLCAIPARFYIPMIQAGAENYQPGEDFEAFTERKGVLAENDPKGVVEEFWYSCGKAWQKEDGTLDEQKIKEFLKGLKNAYGDYDSSVEENSEESMGMSATISGIGMTESSAVQEVNISYGELDLASGKLKANAGLFMGGDYDMLLAVNKELGNGDFGQMPGQAKNIFVPAMITSVSSKSSQQELAEQFVTYLFTRDAQSLSQGGGLPVEKEAFRGSIDGHKYENGTGLVGVGGTDDGYTLGYELKPRTEEEIKKLTGLAEELTTPALQDQVIRDAVTEQGEKVLKGELAPEEGAAAIIQKVNLYLSE